MNQSPRAMTTALVVSLLLNAFLVGLLSARLGFGPRRALWAGPHPMAGPEGLFSAAEAVGARAQMKQLFRERRAALDPTRDLLRSARSEVARSLEAEPFDPQAMRDALARLRVATGSSQQVLHETLVLFAQSLTTIQRRTLAHSPALGSSMQRRR